VARVCERVNVMSACKLLSIHATAIYWLHTMRSYALDVLMRRGLVTHDPVGALSTSTQPNVFDNVHVRTTQSRMRQHQCHTRTRQLRLLIMHA
jgi:hypothetical protein